MARAARDRGYEYLAICDHTPAVGAVRGLTGDDVRRQAEEVAQANEALAPFRVLHGIECDILADGRLDLADDVLAELDWVQASVHGGQRMPREAMTRRVEEALRNPHVRCLSHPTGRLITRRTENALDLDRIYALAVERGVALEVNGLPARLDLSGEHVRDALRGGVKIVCSTDAHSVAGLGTWSSPSARRAAGGRRRGHPQHAPADVAARQVSAADASSLRRRTLGYSDTDPSEEASMKAVVFHGVGDIRLDDVAEPTIEEPTDAIVRLTASAICGTDLHFVRGTMPGMKPGTHPRPRGRRRRRGGRARTCATSSPATGW